MTMVTGPVGREIGLTTFSDLTTVPVRAVWWSDSGQVSVDFDGALTAGEVTAVTRRMATRNANEETLRQRAEGAFQANRDYIALTGPTAAQTTAQVKALSRQMNGIMRVVFGLLDGVD